jgi:hypothetical protein
VAPVAGALACPADSTPLHKNNDTGVSVNLISFAPTTITTLFALAAGLLLGYLH